MLYFLVEIHMENQMNVGNQNTQQVGQNPGSQPMIAPEKQSTNYLMIGGIVLACFVVFGFGGYYLGKNTSEVKQSTQRTQNQTAPIATSTPLTTSAPDTQNTPSQVTSNWKTYTSSKYGFTFKYPQDYQVEERVDGFFVITVSDGGAPQEGISIDARLQGIYETFEKAQNWINTDLQISQTSQIGNWSIFIGVGKEGMIKNIEFKHAISPYKNGAIGVETINNSPYKDIFEDIVKSFQFKN